MSSPLRFCVGFGIGGKQFKIGLWDELDKLVIRPITAELSFAAVCILDYSSAVGLLYHRSAVGIDDRHTAVCSEGGFIAVLCKIGNNLLFACFIILTVDGICRAISTHDGTDIDIACIRRIVFAARVRNI